MSNIIFDQSIRIYFFYIRFRWEGYIYIYHKNEERHDSAFYILASGAIVLTMVLSSNAICKFTSSPCNHLHHLSMGPNNILPNALLMEPLQHFDKVSTSHLSGNWIEPNDKKRLERTKFYSKAVSMILIILISICLRSCMYWFGMISKKNTSIKNH